MIRFVLSIFRHTSGCLVFIVISIVLNRFEIRNEKRGEKTKRPRESL